jgi:nucleolin
VIREVSVKGMLNVSPALGHRYNQVDRDPSSSFGYVDFETISAATKAIESLHQQLFEGRRLTVQYAAYSTNQLEKTNRSPRATVMPRNSPSETLFIGNMSFEMTDRDLNVLFRDIKNVTDVRVAVDRRTGQPRGFAHADFTDVKSAEEGLKLLETKETYGRKLRLDYSYSSNASPRNRSLPKMEFTMGRTAPEEGRDE